MTFCTISPIPQSRTRGARLCQSMSRGLVVLCVCAWPCDITECFVVPRKTGLSRRLTLCTHLVSDRLAFAIYIPCRSPSFCAHYAV